jgi:hypothetical protein
MPDSTLQGGDWQKMAERKTVGDAMTPEQVAFIRGDKETKAPEIAGGPKASKTIELTRPKVEESAESTPKRRSRARNRDAQPETSEILDQVLVPITLRLQHRTAQALKRAYLEQKLKHAKPDTLQEIGEEALSDWLEKEGYIS